MPGSTRSAAEFDADRDRLNVGMFNLLPSRPTLDTTEALDGYLERLAEANGISTATLHKLMLKALSADTTALAFLMVSPQPDAIGTIAGFGGVDRAALRAATLMRYGGGLPLHLEGLDPRQRHTYRRIVTQGWFPPMARKPAPRAWTTTGSGGWSGDCPW
jgi:hypothetical protein